MPHLKLRGAHLRHYDGRRVESGAITRSHWTCDLVEETLKAMNWTAPAADDTSCKKEVRLLGDHFIFETSDGVGTYQMACGEVYDFVAIRVKTKEGGTSNEIRFSIKSSDPESFAKLGEHMCELYDTMGVMKLVYTGQANLFEQDEAADDADADSTDEDLDDPAGSESIEVAEAESGEASRGTIAAPPRKPRRNKTRGEMSASVEIELDQRKHGLEIISKSLESEEASEEVIQ